VAADPDESTRAQNVVVGQLILAAAWVPSCSTGCGRLQLPDCQTETEPSDRATAQWEAVAHDTEYVREPTPGMDWAIVHIDPSKTRACPVRSRAMQKVVVGHDTECSTDWPGEEFRVQVAPVSIAMSPSADTTTQKVGETQVMSWTGLVAVPSSTCVSWPQVVPLKVVTTPAVLTEAQNVGDVHDTRYSPPVGLDGASPAADEIVQAVPLKTTARWSAKVMQNVGDAQDTLSRVLPGVTGRGFDQVAPFHPMALPDSSTAWQNELDVHDTP